ncbi:DUF2878 domain-containing protein [Psychrobium sp. 1_MG-2023]|uniref:DUF2878 domain-containing protein n=1 Tax=Psychrobium sp. 1_MG-2023 TaxID=3062624 RepID=UPI000C31E134|nr:DUF2878 domain-containing protein [Psychrobium sp. 1_MG-2023]MDP2562163.1 DUF2878 domain-containing protein [Psychrobium sp. 1_MG-2023]PKF57165.1 DUF2878 domain-containing protein [Alteromonadales bacterium alter-6D02]
MVLLLLNLLGFNLMWFGLVFWGNLFIPIALVWLCCHLMWISTAPAKEARLIATISIIGICVDSALQLSHIFIFDGANLLPFWLITLWFCFSATLCHSLKFLERSILFQVLTGLLAPLSYIAGYQLNAVEFGLPLIQTYALLSVVWGLLMVSFFYIKSRIFEKEYHHV